MASSPPPTKPTRSAPNGKKPDASNPKLTLFPGWIWWVIFGLVLLWNLGTLFATSGQPMITLSYTDFLGQVRANNVQSLKIAGQQATGQLKNAISVPTAIPSTTAANATTVPGGTTGSAAPGTSTSFDTVLPAQGDPQLLPLLDSQGVQVTNVDASAGSWLVTLLVNGLPVLALVGLMLFMGRQFQTGQQSALGFGRSKARRYEFEHPPVTFADVAGADESKAELSEIVDFLRNPDRYHLVGARLPRGVLLIGPPGTGKTLLARAVAGEAGVPFFSISASEFVEMFVGVGASRVRDLFVQAKAAAPSILFVDELDAVGRQRGVGLGGGNDEREQTLNQLLVEMDGFDDRAQVIVLAATNRPDVLDSALLRPGRFDRQVTLGLPDRSGRSQILAVHIREKPVARDVDLELLARITPGFSGADLANLVNEAALQAAHGKRDQIGASDFDHARDKIILGVERPHLTLPEERKVVAYHEAGHALVAVCTPGADPVNKVTIIPHGRAIGVTEQVPFDDRLNYSRSFLRGKLAVMLGGRTAEEIVFDEPTTGAENDLEEATKLARRMVAEWGMVESIGPVYYDGEGTTNILLGRDIVQNRGYADQTAAKLDEAVTTLLREAHQAANAFITDHRSQLDQIVTLLLDRETMSGDDVRKIVGYVAQPPRRASSPPMIAAGTPN